jgi:hypothetical protein
MFLTGSVCLPHSTPPVVVSVLGLYPSCVGQQPSFECTTVQCLGAQLASIIPHGVTSQKTVTFNNPSEVSGPARQYYSVRRPAAPLCYLGTKMADPEACDSVSASNRSCDHTVAQLCTVEFGLHSSANPPYDVVLGWLVTAAVQEPYLFVEYSTTLYQLLETAVAQWLRYCATNRKVAGSIPDGVIGIFHWHNPSDSTMALGSTQPLTEMSTRSISWG